MEQIENLEKKLEYIIQENNRFKKTKVKKEKEKIEDSIILFIKNLIEKANLMHYDLNIKDQYYDIDFFIYNLENIIEKQKRNLK